jgi:hypothetical protein
VNSFAVHRFILYWNYNVNTVVGVSHLWCPLHWCPHSYDICAIFTCKKVQTSSFLLHRHLPSKTALFTTWGVTVEGLPCSIYGTNTNKYQTFTIDGIVEVLKPPLITFLTAPKNCFHSSDKICTPTKGHFSGSVTLINFTNTSISLSWSLTSSLHN